MNRQAIIIRARRVALATVVASAIIFPNSFPAFAQTNAEMMHIIELLQSQFWS